MERISRDRPRASRHLVSKQRRDYLIGAEDDGLPAADVGSWAIEKYRRLAMYAEMFSTGMKNRWGRRVYIDLFSGPGHAIIRETGMRVLTSPLLALSVKDRFDKYIFCDRESEYIEALRQRAQRMAPNAELECVEGDANERVHEIAALIPPHSRAETVLSFCFVDPFGLDIHLETIAALGGQRAMDFLVLLALAMDANRNWDRYTAIGNQRVDRFLGDTTWRERWARAARAGWSPIRFLAEEYAQAMSRLGYLTTSLDQMLEVRTLYNNMRLYYLAFFSKSEKGYGFWREVQKYSTDQLGLEM